MCDHWYDLSEDIISTRRDLDDTYTSYGLPSLVLCIEMPRYFVGDYPFKCSAVDGIRRACQVFSFSRIFIALHLLYIYSTQCSYHDL